jgi:phage repressor protein C with HTH and peptisase S24 domain
MFHLPVGEKGIQPEHYVVDMQKEILREKGARGAGYGGGDEREFLAIPICDVDLGYTSRISDEEENRFQLPVSLLGYRKAAHRGGEAYRIGTRDLLHLRGQEMRLVNVGPADRVKHGQLGYPLCVVCGATRSPYASDAEIARFTEIHRERCGREPGWLGVSADTHVDTLLVQGLSSRAEGVNLGEAVRQGASRVLEMDPDDLHILVLPTAEDRWDLLIFDPTPGGLGLLAQILERWAEVRTAALEIVAECKGQCERSCYECLRSYRNIYYHGILDRHLAKGLLEELPMVQLERDIPPLVVSATVGTGGPTNVGEAELAALLKRAGFPTPLQQHPIPIGHPAPTTTPDFAYVDPGGDPKVVIYLDGLSKGIHGNEKQAQRDAMIRSVLEADGWQVLVIARSELTDQQAMLLHFKRLAHALKQKDHAKVLAEDPSWFAPIQKAVQAAQAVVREVVRDAIRLVSREMARPFETHLPVYSLGAAAGKFGEGRDVAEDGWVEVPGMRLREGMFVAQVVGKSMEPRIPDGSYCVFRAPVQGSRQGKIVLVQHHGLQDPETGGRYTVKRYDSEKITDGAGGWRHARVTLSPLNPEYEPIVLTPESEEHVQIVAEWLAVLGRA